MLISIRHTLKFDFGEPLQRLLLHLLLSPQSGPTQRLVDWSIGIGDGAHAVPLVDGFANRVLFASLTGVNGPVEIAVAGTVETVSGNGVLGWPMGEPVPWLYHRVTPSTRVPVSVWGKFRGEASQRDSQLGAMHGLMERVHDMINERAEASAGPEQSQSQSGMAGTQSQAQSQAPPHDEIEVAVDPAIAYAQTFIGSARALGLPARFVSGYYLAADEDDCESGVHAWAEAHVEGLGWIGFDPRLNLCPTDRHVRMAVGLDAESAVPVRAYPPVGAEALPVETTEILVAEAAAR